MSSDLRVAIRSAPNIEALAELGRDLKKEARRQVNAGGEAARVTSYISGMNDELCERIIELESAVNGLGVECCWIVMGSQGRCEQTLHTDQDNAIIFETSHDAEAVRQALCSSARRVNEYMDRCGIPLCRGNIMAGNPQWCLTLGEWKERFSSWLDYGHPEALLNAAIFFDFRPLCGATRLARELRSWLAERAHEHTRFLLQLTCSALENRPPLGFFGRFTLSTHGDIPHALDLKVNGVTPFVDAARVYSLAAGVIDTGTVSRFQGAAAASLVHPTQSRVWTEAFLRIQTLRLRIQALANETQAQTANIIDPDKLSSADRRALKEAMREGVRLQQCLTREFAGLSPSFGA